MFGIDINNINKTFSSNFPFSKVIENSRPPNKKLKQIRSKSQTCSKYETKIIYEGF